MEVQLTPDQGTQLSRIAAHAGTDPALLVKDAALRPLKKEEARFRETVPPGIAQADQGEFIERRRNGRPSPLPIWRTPAST